jgi:DNA invertase Pin-like site-specific DNA recombinase
MKEEKSILIQAIRDVRDVIYAAVREQLADDSRTYQQIADSTGCSSSTVQRLAQMDGITRPVGPKPKSSNSEVPNGNE